MLLSLELYRPLWDNWGPCSPLGPWLDLGVWFSFIHCWVLATPLLSPRLQSAAPGLELGTPYWLSGEVQRLTLND